MDNNRKSNLKLLEKKIEDLVREVLRESEGDKENIKRGPDTIDNSQAYKRQYKAIQRALTDKKVDATGIMSSALGIDLTKDDSARSHAFKKLHQDKTPDGTGNYKFSPEEIAKIFNSIPS